MVFRRRHKRRQRGKRRIGAHEPEDMKQRNGKVYDILMRELEPTSESEPVFRKGRRPVDNRLGNAGAAR